MRNATHTTSGGTSTLKSLITRAPPFGLRLPASFQPGTAGSAFLMGLPPGFSGQQPRAPASGLNPTVINWHSGPSSGHPLPRPGQVTSLHLRHSRPHCSPGRTAAAWSRPSLPIRPRFSCLPPGSDSPADLVDCARGSVAGHVTDAAWVKQPPQTLVPAGSGLFWPAARPSSSSCVPRHLAAARRPGTPASCSSLDIPQSTVAVVRGRKSATFPTRRPWVRPARSVPLSRRAAWPEDGRPIPARLSMPPRERPEPGRPLICCGRSRGRVAGRHSAPKSGFRCHGGGYGDLARHLFAIEAGRPGDPAMNWTCPSIAWRPTLMPIPRHRGAGPRVQRGARFLLDGQRLGPAVARRPRSTSIAMMDECCLDGRKYGVHFAGGTPGEHDGSHPECAKTLMIGYVYRVAYRGGGTCRWAAVNRTAGLSDLPIWCGCRRPSEKFGAAARGAGKSVPGPARSWLTSNENSAPLRRPAAQIGLACTRRRVRCPAGWPRPRGGPPAGPPGADGAAPQARPSRAAARPAGPRVPTAAARASKAQQHPRVAQGVRLDPVEVEELGDALVV